MYVLTPISNKINPIQQHKKNSLSREKKDFSFMGYGEHNYIIYNLWSQEVKQQKNTKETKDGSQPFLPFFQQNKDKILTLFALSAAHQETKKSFPLLSFLLPLVNLFFPTKWPTLFFSFLMAFIAKRRVFKGLPAGCFGSWFASEEDV